MTLLQGANINDLDNEGMSPLLLGAAKKAWVTVEVLLKNKSDVTIRDKKNRNILHLIIRNGGKPEQFSFCMCTKVSSDTMLLGFSVISLRSHKSRVFNFSHVF